jgi:micrococcal nuclease
MTPLRLLLALIPLAVAGPALADPCTLIPDRGPTPSVLARGQTFAGPVVYVGDGDSLCVEVRPGAGGAGWAEVRIADFNAPELSQPGGRAARDTLSRLVMGRRVSCVAENRTYDRVAAVCLLNGRSLSDHLRRAGVRQGGN